MGGHSLSRPATNSSGSPASWSTRPVLDPPAVRTAPQRQFQVPGGREAGPRQHQVAAPERMMALRAPDAQPAPGPVVSVRPAESTGTQGKLPGVTPASKSAAERFRHPATRTASVRWGRRPGRPAAPRSPRAGTVGENVYAVSVTLIRTRTQPLLVPPHSSGVIRFGRSGTNRRPRGRGSSASSAPHFGDGLGQAGHAPSEMADRSRPRCPARRGRVPEPGQPVRRPPGPRARST